MYESTLEALPQSPVKEYKIDCYINTATDLCDYA